MSDETLVAPSRANWRSPTLVGGVAFLGGVALTAAALGVSGWFTPPPPPVAVLAAPQPVAVPALPEGTDVATLAAREQALASKLDQLELRIHDADGSARNASAYATRAERMMIVAGVRSAIERGQALGPLEAQLRRRFGESDSEAVADILNAAREPVTLESLRLALNTIGPRLIAGDDTLGARARRLLGDMVVVRPAGAPSPRAADRLRRALRALDRGDLEAALGEVAHMPGGATAEAEPWVNAARRYAEAQRGLRAIESTALAAPAATPPPAPTPATVATAPAPAEPDAN